MLGPLLFIICINYLVSKISNDVHKFVGDTKDGRLIRADEGASALQCELDRVYD